MNVILVINHYQVTASCSISLLNDYTYTLLQRNYCLQLLNSSEIDVTLNDTDYIAPNTVIPISVNVQSLILNSTWSISVQVSNRFSNYTTAYTNITDTSNVYLLMFLQFILLFSIGSIILLCHSHYYSVIPSAEYNMSSITSLFGILSSNPNFVMIFVIVTSTTLTSSHSQFITACASSSSVPSSVDNIIPVVIGTTVTIMILLITVILLLLVFIVLVCCKRDKKVS